MYFPADNPGFSNLTRNAAIFIFALLLLAVVFLSWKIMSLRNIPAESSSANYYGLDFFFKDLQEKQDYQNTLHLVFSYPDSARTLATEAIQDFEKQQNELAQLPYYNILGVSFFLQSDYNASLEYFYHTLHLAHEYNIDNKTANVYQNIGAVFTSLGYYSDALSYLLKANSLFEQMQDSLNHAGSQNNIGCIYLEIGAFDKAKQNFDIAYNKYREMDHPTGMASVLNQLGKYFKKLNKPDSAVYYYDQAISIGTEIHNHYALSSAFLKKGKLLSDLDDHKEAIAYYLKSDSVSLQIDHMQGRSSANLAIAKSYLRKSEFDRAFSFATKAHDMAREIGNKKIEFQVNEIFSRIFEKKEDYENALKYRNLAIDQKDELQKQSQAYQIYSLEIEQLNRDKEMHQMLITEQHMRISRKSNQLYLTIVSALALLTILSFVYYFIVSKIRQKQSTQNFENKIRHSLDMTKAVLEAEIQERKRIGMEMHDGLGPLLGLVKLNITNIMVDDDLSQKKKNELLKNAAANLDEILKEMKFISKNLAPLILFEKGFESAIKDLVIRLQNLKYLKVHLSMNGWDGNVDAYVEHSLYRAVLEVINNIINHANASTVNIEVLKYGKEITVIIEDDGVGFDPAISKSKGLGLKNAATRIEGLHGRFYIDSMPDRGTIIIMDLPNGELTKMKNENNKVVSY